MYSPDRCRHSRYTVCRCLPHRCLAHITDGALRPSVVQSAFAAACISSGLIAWHVADCMAAFTLERMLVQACEDVQHALKVKLKMSSAVMRTGRFSPAGDNVAGEPVKGVWHFGGAHDKVSHSTLQQQWCCMLCSGWCTA